jgi:hypothetical protein
MVDLIEGVRIDRYLDQRLGLTKQRYLQLMPLFLYHLQSLQLGRRRATYDYILPYSQRSRRFRVARAKLGEIVDKGAR